MESQSTTTSVTGQPIADLNPPVANLVHPNLNHQQKAFVFHFVQSRSLPAAAVAAGVHPLLGKEWLEDPKITEAIDFYDDATAYEIKVDRNKLTHMLFESHRKAATSTEEIAAIRELGKMHGCYEPDKIQTQNVHYHRVEQLEQLSDEELLSISGSPTTSLAPE